MLVHQAYRGNHLPQIVYSWQRAFSNSVSANTAINYSNWWSWSKSTFYGPHRQWFLHHFQNLVPKIDFFKNLIWYSSQPEWKRSRSCQSPPFSLSNLEHIGENWAACQNSSNFRHQSRHSSHWLAFSFEYHILLPIYNWDQCRLYIRMAAISSKTCKVVHKITI